MVAVGLEALRCMRFRVLVRNSPVNNLTTFTRAAKLMDSCSA